MLCKKSDSIDTKAFANDCLRTHNELRCLHSAPALQLDKKMCEYAQKWATVSSSTRISSVIHLLTFQLSDTRAPTQKLAQQQSLVHNPENRYGENIYMCSGFKPSGQQVVRTWYNECEAYDFKQPQFSSDAGHFTAVVWHSSARLGIAIAHCQKTGAYYVVANYDPPGNVSTQFEANVRPTITVA